MQAYVYALDTQTTCIRICLHLQIFGRLPFDDSNHRNLIKQIQKGPQFKEGIEVTDECKDLILKILVKADQR